MTHSIVMPSLPRALARTAAVLALATVAGCVTAPPPKPVPPPAVEAKPVLTPVDWSALPGWSDDPVDTAWPAFEAGCQALLANPRTQPTWQAVCAAGAEVAIADTAVKRRFFEAHFIPHRLSSSDGATTGLVTGYYEPLLEGSRTGGGRYGVPLYATPDDLLIVELASLHPELKDKRVRGRAEGRRVLPYWTRSDIESGKAPLDGKALVYVNDPIDAFFLQIQGSGRVRLPDGSVMRVGYADQNGHPYKSIGRVLIDRGELTPDTASMQAIKAWGERNAAKLPALLDENASYVFFREVPPPAPGSLAARIDGPFGSLGVPLLAQRTIAVDPRAIPLGAPVYLATTYPLSAKPMQRLTFAQDTGGAIRGPIRADFFWGFGEEAAREAGRMRQQGSLWLLWPKGMPLP
jgi:membrane-bound lytic murein transglycosylase A